MKEYFKPLARFKKREHPFDIGMPFSWWKGHYDRHFLNNLYDRKENEFEAFYKYHLSHFLKVNEGSEEVEFYKHVRDIVQDGIAGLIKEDNPNSKTKHERTNVQKAQLRAFTDYLNSIDQWYVRPQHEVNTEKDATIARLQNQIAALEKQLNEIKEFDVVQKIRIEEGHLPTVIDLIQQLRDLQLPSDRKLLRCDYKTPYYKMISKYFSIDGKDIPIETTKNYFSDKQNDVSVKGTSIPLENKLFKIIPETVKKASKKSNKA
ncbi:hypothetical protein [Mucilaginibacter gotjawali]|uniref:Uncharacterized protein n=1 Tax=Mucilaginibacter gotjawali TaxID=1550579 RepID=A0A839SIL4_9SPHI|nr:hypothetical protein [Mucilaginibacter gotjawali]MBB3056720.1 hypothetical protein [Mucilaginibacter gotjawali]